MGFGDFIVWTSIIRDLYKHINNGTMNERLDKIKKLKYNKKHYVDQVKQESDT